MLSTDKQTKQRNQKHNLLCQGGKYSSAFIVLGVRLTKDQQIHLLCSKCLNFCIHIYWNLYSIFNVSVVIFTLYFILKMCKNWLQKHFVMNNNISYSFFPLLAIEISVSTYLKGRWKGVLDSILIHIKQS